MTKNNKRCLKCKTVLYLMDILKDQPNWCRLRMCVYRIDEFGLVLLRSFITYRGNLNKYTFYPLCRTLSLPIWFYYRLYKEYMFIKTLYKNKNIQFYCCECYNKKRV